MLLVIGNVTVESLAVSAADGKKLPASRTQKPLQNALQNPKGSSRHLVFPGTSTLGALLTCKLDRDHSIRAISQIAGAQGSVDVLIPSGCGLEFEPNRRIFENPDLIEKIQDGGIDCLKVGFISMDDREDGMCDRALAKAKHFKNLTMIDVDRSDATDKGFASLSTVKSLQVISCFRTDITGSSFAALSQLPALIRLNMAWSTIDQSTIKTLANCKKLKFLDLTHTRMNAEGMIGIGKCSNLEELHISSNRKINDQMMSSLLTLKSLRRIDLRDTAVTVRGLKILIPLQLQYIALPVTFSRADRAQVRRYYPHAELGTSNLRISADDQKLFAPLK